MIFLPSPFGADRFGYQSLGAVMIKGACVTLAPKDGNIAKLGFTTGTVTTSQTLKISLQGVGADGFPNGTILDSGNAYATQASPASNTYYLVTLNSAASVTRGQLIAVVIEWDSTQGSLEIALWEKLDLQKPDTGTMYDCFYQSATWYKGAALPHVAFEYSDGSYAKGTTWPIKQRWLESININSTPDEVGIYFQLPFSCQASGIWAYITTWDVSEYQGVLYGETTAQATIPGGVNAGSNEYSRHIILFGSNVTINANTWYRATLKPTTTLNIALITWEVASALTMDSLVLGQNCIKTERTDGGAWTNTTTRRPMMGLVIDSINAGGGGGGYLIDGGLIR